MYVVCLLFIWGMGSMHSKCFCLSRSLFGLVKMSHCWDIIKIPIWLSVCEDCQSFQKGASKFQDDRPLNFLIMEIHYCSISIHTPHRTSTGTYPSVLWDRFTYLDLKSVPKSTCLNPDSHSLLAKWNKNIYFPNKYWKFYYILIIVQSTSHEFLIK